MKILIISSIYPDTSHPAFGTFVHSQVQALEAQGINCKLVVNTDPRQGWWFAIRKYVILLLKVIQSVIFTDFDVIHTHYVFPSAFFGLLPKFLRGKPLVITAHGGDITDMPSRHPILWHLSRFSLHQADAIIAVSEYLKREIVTRFDVPSKLVHVANMGIDLELFKPMARSEAQLHLGINLDARRKVILFVGRCEESKGGQYLIKAIPLLPDRWREMVDVWFVGDGKAVSSWKKLSASLGIANQIHFAGAYPHTEIPRWFSSADIFVLPTLSESFGLVLLEAMACHIPVIASDVGGISELIKDQETGLLVEVRSESAIAEQLNRLLTDQALSEKLISNASQSVNIHSVDAQARYVIDVYNAVGCNKDKGRCLNNPQAY